VMAAVGAGKRITVHGDFDVDGVCATSILVGALRGVGADCDWLIPDRIADGYGIAAANVRRLAERGTSLMITVDCGITAVEEVALCHELGMDIVVTDHHTPKPQLPDCPILHPTLDGYPFAELCGTAVACGSMRVTAPWNCSSSRAPIGVGHESKRSTIVSISASSRPRTNVDFQ